MTELSLGPKALDRPVSQPTPAVSHCSDESVAFMGLTGESLVLRADVKNSIELVYSHT